MSPGETTGIVIITVAVIQGLIKLAEHVVSKYSEKKAAAEEQAILHKLDNLSIKVGTSCGLNESQSQQLQLIHDTLTRVDADGVPLTYLPRSWMVTQKEIVDKMQDIVQTEYKMLGIIERLERRLERPIGDNKEI